MFNNDDNVEKLDGIGMLLSTNGSASGRLLNETLENNNNDMKQRSALKFSNNLSKFNEKKSSPL